MDLSTCGQFYVVRQQVRALIAKQYNTYRFNTTPIETTQHWLIQWSMQCNVMERSSVQCARQCHAMRCNVECNLLRLVLYCSISRPTYFLEKFSNPSARVWVHGSNYISTALHGIAEHGAACHGMAWYWIALLCICHGLNHEPWCQRGNSHQIWMILEYERNTGCAKAPLW